MTSTLATKILLSAILPIASAAAANLKPETAAAWDQYVQTADTLLQQRRTFLWIDEVPERAGMVRGRQIVVAPAGPQVPKKVPSGLIHDWIGAAFIPGATMQDVLTVVRDYTRYKEYSRPNVTVSRPLATGESQDRFSMVLLNKSLFSKTALESEYRASYIRLDERRWYSVSETTRIQEIAEYGAPGQHLLPEDQGTGLIWRLHSVTRFEERDGGLYVEVEVIALSRDIPAAVRWIAEPIVRRVSRDSLATALRQTSEATYAAIERKYAAAGSGPSRSLCRGPGSF